MNSKVGSIKHSEKKDSRIFIIDASACVPHGHNIDGMIRFSQMFHELGHETICVVPAVAADWTIENNFDYLLSNIYSIQFNPPKQFFSNSKFKNIYRDALQAVWYLLALIKITYNFSELKSKYKITNKDYIFFPNGDHVSITASLIIFPRITKLVRLINVFETLSIRKFWNFSKLAKLIKNNKNVKVLAETLNYCEYLQKEFSVEAFYSPFPLKHRKIEKYEKKATQVSFLGSQRGEKGFEDIPKLVEQLNEDHFKVIVQGAIKSWGDAYDHAIKQLTIFDNVRILPPFLSRQELDSELNNTSVLVLPYKKSTYEMRGSAMLVEALENAIPIVASTGTAIAREIEKYQLGATFNENVEFKSAIGIALNLKREEFNKAITYYQLQVRKNYLEL